MSASLDVASNWNFRVFDKRLVVVKTKNDKVRKIAALDILTNLTIAIEVPQTIQMQNVETNKEYLANLKVYTSKNLNDIDADYINFFQALDIDQSIENFIKAYWLYPSKIRFQLDSLEEP
ncbi:MAG: hypothetical protein NWE95_00275 [Candidatus Bathyarchaeota archaeon]|nr:hypothetical protein [Candidatus Bathyarchaeota archaeon]